MVSTSHNNTGVTVLELLVTLSIMLAAASTAVFGFTRSLSGWRLNASVRQLVMDLRVARMRAMSENVDWRLRLAPGTTYQPQRKAPNGTYANEGAATALSDGVHIVDCTGAGSSISFRPAGYAGSFGTITLADDSGTQKRVIVDIAGRARVQ
jgi:Tfp pilus assembly protein FimT